MGIIAVSKEFSEGVNLIIHSGPHHADEVLVAAMLSLGDDVTIFRTKDRALIDEILKKHPGGDIIVADVGGIYDPEHWRFDHHQKGAPERADGLRFCAAGQIWAKFHTDIIENTLRAADFQVDITAAEAEAIYHRIDGDFMREVDAFDNGQATPHEGLTLSQIIPMFNPGRYSKIQDSDWAFAQACLWAREGFSYIVQSAAEAALGRSEVEKAIDAAEGCFAVLPYQVADWQGAICESLNPKAKMAEEAKNSELLFVIYPRTETDWGVQCIPPDNDPWGQRCPFPMEWRSLGGDALAQATGVSDAIFCHQDGFFLSAGSRKSAEELATKAAEIMRGEA